MFQEKLPFSFDRDDRKPPVDDHRTCMTLTELHSSRCLSPHSNPILLLPCNRVLSFSHQTLHSSLVAGTGVTACVVLSQARLPSHISSLWTTRNISFVPSHLAATCCYPNSSSGAEELSFLNSPTKLSWFWKHFLCPVAPADTSGTS
jgi:hypothetical protein